MGMKSPLLFKQTRRETMKLTKKHVLILLDIIAVLYLTFALVLPLFNIGHNANSPLIALATIYLAFSAISSK